jgi:nitrogen-specific signal transduction histidine kinase
VEVRLEVQNGMIAIEVQDNGPGVPESIRTNLFQPFVSEGKQKGSGLGLTLAYCIAAEHGGEVVLLATGPGETIFRMTMAGGTTQRSATEGVAQKRWAAG